jgi:hypothetical protein
MGSIPEEGTLSSLVLTISKREAQLKFCELLAPPTLSICGYVNQGVIEKYY